MLESIKVFLEVYKTKSFSLAAENLNKSRSKISRDIAQLEDELGKQLFLRSSKFFQPTLFGEYLYNKTKHIPEFLDSAINSFDNTEQNIQAIGTINLALGAAISSTILSKLHEFYKIYPNISLNISIIHNLTEWTSQNIDIALTANYIYNPNLVNRFIKTEYIQLFCSSDYASKCGIPKTPQDLVNYQVIGIVDDKYRQIEFVKMYNLSTHEEYILEQKKSFLRLNSAIHATIGMSMDCIFGSFRTIMKNYLSEGSVVCILPDWVLYEINYHIVTRKIVSKEEQLVISFISSCLKT